MAVVEAKVVGGVGVSRLRSAWAMSAVASQTSINDRKRGGSGLEGKCRRG